ncbi:cytochrome P450 2G1-like [Engystomops pustulosus]|uniref:cytochrome P450 2G1-like n=1 Tax=Engystomops pustulosus TaxID=76066 RepID=UPI003AFA789A
MDITWMGILILLFLFIYSTWDNFYRNRNLPPGPTPLPLIGSILHIKKGRLVKSFIKLWDQYGSVYTLYFGSRLVIVLCGYETVKEALVDRGEEFGGRGPLPVMDKFAQGYGIGHANGERWKIMRSFTMKTLKSFGLAKKSHEWKIQKEAQCIVDEFRKFDGHPFDPSKQLLEAVSNVLCAVIFGNRFDYTDGRFSKLIDIVEETFQLASSSWGKLHIILPSSIDYLPGPHHRIIQLSEELAEFVHERVKASQKSLDLSSPRHFIDSFLIKMEEEKKDPNTEFILRNLLVIAHNLFLAGTGTTSTTLRYGLLVLLKYHEVQAKIHEEIDQVIGRDRVPCFDDREQMPYTQAVIHEIQRFCDVSPLNASHMVTKDVSFRGFHIPKGTEILPLLCTVHRDPKQFASPWKFNPNHFLDENGKFQRNDAVMAFSAGKRICVGENLARMELFIFLTTILQSFSLVSQVQLTEDDIAPKMSGFLNGPIDFELSFLPRSNG